MEQNFRKYLIISLILHIVFVVVFMFGMPSIFDKEPIVNEVMVFDMVDASDFNNIKNQNPNAKKDDAEIVESKRVKTPAPLQEEETEEEKPEPKKEEAPVPEKTPEIIPEKEEKKEPKKEKEKEQPKKEEKKKDIVIPKEATKKKPEKKPEKKPVKKQEDPLDKIMQELEKESEGQSTTSDVISKTSNVDEGRFAKGDNYDESSPLSVTEIALIKKQIQDNYTVPVQAVGLKIEVVLSVRLAENGTVLDTKIKNTICPPGSSDVCDLVRDNALRAVKKASPLQKLRPERYDIWQNFSLRFNAEGLM